jgi:methyl-accepting chemotaxis protein
MKRLSLKIIILSICISLLLSASFGAITIITAAGRSESGLTLLESSQRTDFDRQARDLVHTAISMLEALYKKSEIGEITFYQAKVLGASLLRELRYAGNNYFWADTTEGLNIVYAGRPEEGTNRLDAVDQKGTKYIKEMIEKASQEGGGYTTYWFPKLDSTTEIPMRSYTILYKPFGWVVGTGNYLDDIETQIENRKRELAVQSRQVMILMLAMNAGFFFLSGLIAFFVGQRISKPIREVAEALADISRGEGDLSRSIEVRTKDETGQVSRYFNEFTEKLSAIISKISSSSQKLSETGEDLMANSTETAAAVNQISSNITSINQRIISQAAGVNETMGTVQQILKNIDSLNALIENQASSVTESSAAIEEMVSNIGSVAKNVEHANALFNKLSLASDNGKNRINEVIERISEIEKQSNTLSEANSIITGIATQTNLLAMNAAIEAAHAGEAGRGFSVVSDEIRKLAEDAAAQSKKVSSDIKKIKEAIKKVVLSTKEAEKAFDDTLTLVRTVDSLENEIRNSVVEQNTGSRQILEALTQINGVTTKVKDGSSEMSGGSKQILASVGSLIQVTEEIRQGMGEIASGIGEINKAAVSISDMGNRNKEHIREVNKEVSRFKVRES